MSNRSSSWAEHLPPKPSTQRFEIEIAPDQLIIAYRELRAEGWLGCLVCLLFLGCGVGGVVAILWLPTIMLKAGIGGMLLAIAVLCLFVSTFFQQEVRIILASKCLREESRGPWGIYEHKHIWRDDVERIDFSIFGPDEDASACLRVFLNDGGSEPFFCGWGREQLLWLRNAFCLWHSGGDPRVLSFSEAPIVIEGWYKLYSL